MRHTVQHADESGQRAGNAGFMVATVISAAIMAAFFTLHGGPDLFAGKFPTFPQLGIQSP